MRSISSDYAVASRERGVGSTVSGVDRHLLGHVNPSVFDTASQNGAGLDVDEPDRDLSDLSQMI